MKKQYMKPVVQVMSVQQQHMICNSGTFGDPATEPAHSREFEDDWEIEGVGIGIGM